MSKYLKVAARVLPMVVLSLVTFAAFAQGEAREPIGHVTAAFGTVSWRPSIEAESIHLSVIAPDGTRFEKDFPSGKALTIRLDEIGSRTIADGSYSYELRATPRISTEVRAALAKARAVDDNAAIERIQREAGILETTVQSGAFRVTNGNILQTDVTETRKQLVKTPNAALKPVPLDQVIADDLIVQGSECVGLDCVNNESFGFDTIRLKENNTRILFMDTSTSTGFPTHDWQLTANDSASGGAEKFSIEDITAATVPFTVTGSAPTNSVFVASNGKVGFRTSSPALDLHISTGDTPAIRQEQTNASGFTAQTWDIGANEANWFVRDVTGGSRLPLRIRPGAATSSIDVAASGNVGIGTASPTFGKLDVKGSGWFEAAATLDAVRILAGVGGTSNLIDSNVQSGSTVLPLRITSNASTAPNQIFLAANGSIGIGTSTPNVANAIEHSSGAKLTTGGVWTDASSRALKFDICDVESTEALDALKELNPVHFTYKVNPNEHHVGFIAEDVPSIVATENRGSIAPMDIVAVLTRVVKDQQKTIEALQQRLDNLEKVKN